MSDSYTEHCKELYEKRKKTAGVALDKLCKNRPEGYTDEEYRLLQQGMQYYLEES